MSSVKSEILKGVFWIGVAKYSGIFISLGVTAILARNITPDLFGTIAIATVIIIFLEIFTDLGIGSAIIQFKSLTKKQLDSLFTLGAILGVFLSLLLIVASPFIAKYYNDQTLTTVCYILSISLLFNALNVVPNGLMLKQKRFKTISIRTLAFQVSCGIIAIIGALNDWGIYALLVTPLITSIGVFIVNYINYPQHFIFPLDTSVIKHIWGYSSYQFLFSISNYFSRNIDKLIIGKYFSMSDLGFYDKSYRLMQLPIQNITYVISPVLHPVLSSLQNDRLDLADKNKKLAVILSNISFPIGIFLFFSAKQIIEIIFGPQWGPSIPVFQILAISVPLQVILSTSGAPFQAAGKTNHLFFVGLSNTTITVTGFLIAALFFNSINAMAWAWVVTLLINFCVSYLVMYRITFNTRPIDFFVALIPQLLNSSIVFIIVWAIRQYLLSPNYFNLNPITILFFNIIIIGLPTIIIATALKQYNFFSLMSQASIKIKNKIHKKSIS